MWSVKYDPLTAPRTVDSPPRRPTAASRWVDLTIYHPVIQPSNQSSNHPLPSEEGTLMLF